MTTLPTRCGFLRPIVRALVLSAFALVAAFAADDTKRTYDLPAGDAPVTLRRFSEISGRETLFAAESVRGVKTNAVKGEFTPREAIERMLLRTELTAEADARTGALAVKRAAPAPVEKPAAAAPRATPLTKADVTKSTEEAVVLSPFTVNSEKDTGYQATNTLAGTRLNTPIKDLGASISVYNKNFLDDIGATSANDLLIYATGMEAAGPGGNFFQRRRRQHHGAERRRRWHPQQSAGRHPRPRAHLAHLHAGLLYLRCRDRRLQHERGHGEPRAQRHPLRRRQCRRRRRYHTPPRRSPPQSEQGRIPLWRQ